MKQYSDKATCIKCTCITYSELYANATHGNVSTVEEYKFFFKRYLRSQSEHNEKINKYIEDKYKYDNMTPKQRRKCLACSPYKPSYITPHLVISTIIRTCDSCSYWWNVYSRDSELTDDIINDIKANLLRIDALDNNEV